MELFVVPLSFAVSGQPDGAYSFPHVYRDRLAGVELDASAVALQELVPLQRQVAVQQDALEVLEQLLVGESDLDLGWTRLDCVCELWTRLDRVVTGVIQFLADGRLAWSENPRHRLSVVRWRRHCSYSQATSCTGVRHDKNTRKPS